MSYKQYCAATERTASSTAEVDYQAYTRAHREHKARGFFELHRGDAWVQERYHPTDVERRFSERLKGVGERALRFAEGTPWQAAAVRAASLHVPHVPVTLSAAHLCTAAGVESPALHCGAPSSAHHLARPAWVECDAQRKETAKIGLQELELEVGDVAAPAPVTLPAAVRSREEQDASAALQLASQLDSEMSVRLDLTASAQVARTDGSAAARLQCAVSYLLHVHLFSYWGATQYGSVAHAATCPDYVEPAADAADVAAGDAWLEALDRAIRSRLEHPPIRDVESGRVEVEKQLEVLLQKHAKADAESRFRCSLCSKLFMTLDYVRKHILNKHPDVVEASRQEALNEQCFRNFLADNDNTALYLTAEPSDGGGEGAGASPPSSSLAAGGGEDSRKWSPEGRCAGWGGRYFGRTLSTDWVLHFNSPRRDRRDYDRRDYDRRDDRRGGRQDSRRPFRGSARPRGPPPPVPDGVQHDPREIRSYVDLDALKVPAVEEELDYRLV